MPRKASRKASRRASRRASRKTSRRAYRAARSPRITAQAPVQLAAAQAQFNVSLGPAGPLALPQNITDLINNANPASFIYSMQTIMDLGELGVDPSPTPANPPIPFASRLSDDDILFIDDLNTGLPLMSTAATKTRLIDNIRNRLRQLFHW